jgi:putative addiction module component (TIGR02574 family)
MSFDDLLSAAHHLPALERLLLSDLLRESVPPEQWPGLSDEWVDEIARRSQDRDAGLMEASSWEEVRMRARRQAGLDG